MRSMIKAIVTSALCLFGGIAEAQITIPYTFSPGTVILSAEINAVNSALGDNALNRTGGTMTGSLTVQAVLPDADNTRDLGSAALSFNDAWFDGTVTMATLSLTTLTCTGCVDATQLASTTVTAAAYGSASAVGTFTVDADGRLTTAATTNIAIAATQVTSGNYVATVTAGSGIAVGTGTGTASTPAFALAPLTADWTQSGAYDVVLSNAASEIKIKEDTGDTFYGILEVGNLGAADATYTFEGLSGTVVTSVTAAGGDVTGTFGALVVGNDSHSHTSTTVPSSYTALSITTMTGNVTGNVSGNAGTLTVADTASASTYVGLWEAASGSLAGKSDAALTYNATTGALSATTFSGALSGNASTATALAADPADCSATNFATAIAASGALTCAAIADADVPDSITITTATNFSGSLAGDVTGTQGVTVVGNDSHTHGAGNLTGTTLAAGVVTTSITAVGTITSGIWNAGAVTSSSTLTSSLATGGWGLILDTNTLMVDATTNTVSIGTDETRAKLTIMSGDSGVITLADDADDLFVENSTDAGISIYAPTTGQTKILFGMGTAYSASIVALPAAGAENIAISAGGGTALTVFDTGNVTLGTITSGVWNAGAVTSSGLIISSRGGQAVRLYSTTTGGHQWDIYGSGNDLRVSDNTTGGNFTIDSTMSVAGVLTVNGFGTHTFDAGSSGANRITVGNTSDGTGNTGELRATAYGSVNSTL